MDERLQDLAGQACAALARFRVQTPAFAELFDGMAQLPWTARADPSAGLVRVRKTLQFVVDDAYERQFGEPPGSRPLENLLQRLVKEGAFPKKLSAFANLVRDLGNVGAHTFGERVTVADVTRALEQLLPILQWHAGAAERADVPEEPVPGAEGNPAPAASLSPGVGRRRRMLGWAGVAAVGGTLLVLGGVLVWHFAPPRHANTDKTENIPHPTAPRRAAVSLPDWAADMPAARVLKLVYNGDPPPAPHERLSLRADISALRKGSKTWGVLADGESLASGDGYVLKIVSPQLGYLYVFQVDTLGKLTVLHPSLPGCTYSEGSNPTGGGQDVSVPSAESKQKLKLDNRPGVEHVYAVFTLARWPELESELAVCETKAAPTGAGPTVTEPLRLALRGVGGKEDIDEAAAGAHAAPVVRRDHDYVAEMARGLVVERWFRHVAPDR